MAVNAVQTNKTVADPLATYLCMQPVWLKNRAVTSGERFVKVIYQRDNRIFHLNLN